jgi:hypothetical protein
MCTVLILNDPSYQTLVVAKLLVIIYSKELHDQKKEAVHRKSVLLNARWRLQL